MCKVRGERMESSFVGKLKSKGIENDWDKIQGKGESSSHNQDLLSHSLDVVQITYNILDGIDINTNYSQEDFLGAAFFHDLHKLGEVGGTETLDIQETESMLEKWEIKKEILKNFSLREFTDILKSIHQYTGSSESRTRINTDVDLQKLTYVIRLADGIASTINLSGLYNAGKWRRNSEAVERLNRGLEKKYALGYHQLAEVKPALGNLIHNSVRESIIEKGGEPIASRKDGTVYLLPKTIETNGFLDKITESAKTKFREFRAFVPSKIQSDVFGLKGSVDIAVNHALEELSREGGELDLTNAYQGTVHALADIDCGNYEIAQRNETNLLDWSKKDKVLYSEVPTTQQGTVVGNLLSDLVKDLNSDERSRIEVLDELIQNIYSVDLSKFRDLSGRKWRAKESHIPRVIGNFVYQKSISSLKDRSAKDIIEEIHSTALTLIPDTKTGAVSRLNEYIGKILTIDSSEETIFQSEFLTDINFNSNYQTDYQDLCISCGQKGEFRFRTTQTSPYSKSYMARGLIGEATSDDWTPKLCLPCFLDQALMRALVRSEGSIISNMEDTIFLKIYPGRYLGTKQSKVLKNHMEEFGSMENDAQDYLENKKEYSNSTLLELSSSEEENFSEVDLNQTVSIGSMSALTSSENYFLVAVEDKSDSPTKQVTKTWLKAIQKGLLFRTLYNVDVEISNNPEISVDRPYPEDSGVLLESPPSQIYSIFENTIDFQTIRASLEGITNLAYSTNYARAEGSNDLNMVYQEFRRSLYPGSKIYRATERKYEKPWKIDDPPYQNIFRTCKAIDNWSSYALGDDNMNRLQKVVDSFDISAKAGASAYMIQDPVRTLVNKILKSDEVAREEILDQAAGKVYRRVERKWDNPDVYFGYESDDDVKKLIYKGCATFYDRIFQDMLDGDKIKLANQRNDILDGFYFIVKRRGVSE